MYKPGFRLAGLAIVCLFALAAPAAAFHGGGGGGIGAGPIRITPAIVGGGVRGVGGASMAPVFDRPQRIRDHLIVTGLVGISEKRLVTSSPMVRLRLDGREIPMRLDTQLDGVELQMDLNENYARDLYQSILTKSIEVLGPQDLRDQITRAADYQSKPLVVEGYIFGRTSPYLVLRSTGPE
jgi:hypothetical protein